FRSVALGLFWLVVAGRTAWAVRTGEAWQAAPPTGGLDAGGGPRVVPATSDASGAGERRT
ncbi:MAG: hypothetical protein M0Z46_11505, partial [Actinomycetota bacterium]|nr:hypothetical protein [Actinomycetota bacterium]